MEIEGVTLSPAFAEQTSDYTAVIQEEKEWLNVIYETEQKGLQVEITGNKNLQKGKNMIKLIVKNADGAQSVYQVEVTVQPEQETMASGEWAGCATGGSTRQATQQQKHRWMHPEEEMQH